MDAKQHDCDVASTTWQAWHDIPWANVSTVVARLQTRIAKAVKAGEWRKVRSLQKLLTKSTSAKVLAVRRVTENQGRKTPGVDKQTWGTPDEKWKAVEDLGNKGYKPRPLRRIYIPKANGDKRPLGIPTMRDRAMQALHLLALDPVAKTTGDHHSYGFRRERSTADAIEQVRNIPGRKASPKWVLEGDIKGCFDNIDHTLLLKAVRHHTQESWVVMYIERWLKAPVQMLDGTLVERTRGTPQGGVISPLLANLFLHYVFDKWMQRENADVPFERYADDAVCHCRSQSQAQALISDLGRRFAQCGLELHPLKTRVVYCKDADRRGNYTETSFDFLGFNV